MRVRGSNTETQEIQPQENKYEDTSDESILDKSEESLFVYIDNQIERMNKYVFGGDTSLITFYELNNAMYNYQKVHFQLIEIYVKEKTILNRFKNSFDTWFADKYILVRNELNPRSIAAQKWYSQKEIEMQVRSTYKDEFSEHNTQILIQERKVSFLNRLLDSWEKYNYTLGNLSKNHQAEANSLGVRNGIQ